MTITVTCACGKEYRLADDKAGRRFDCRECGTEVRAPKPEGNITEKPKRAEGDDAEDGDLEEASPVRFAPATPHRSKRKRSDSSRGDREESPTSRKPSGRTALFRGGLIVGVVLAVLGVCWATGLSRELLTFVMGGLVLLTSVGLPLLIDHYNRRQIREEIASYGGTVTRIQWRPFQGSFFSTGWTRRRRGRFYDVTYTDREGQPRSGLCAVSLWGGTAWDDDIDGSLGWGSDAGSHSLPWFVGSMLLLIGAGCLVGVEAFYSIYGETTSGTVTNVRHYETTRRSSRSIFRGRSHQRRLTVHYAYKDKDGTQQHRTVDSEVRAFINKFHFEPREGGTVNVQYVPGNSYWTRLVTSPHATDSTLFYLVLLAILIATPFVLLMLLDYFDVFNLNGTRRRTRTKQED